jgi:hypothetical protein
VLEPDVVVVPDSSGSEDPFFYAPFGAAGESQAYPSGVEAPVPPEILELVEDAEGEVPTDPEFLVGGEPDVLLPPGTPGAPGERDPYGYDPDVPGVDESGFSARSDDPYCTTYPEDVKRCPPTAHASAFQCRIRPSRPSKTPGANPIVYAKGTQVCVTPVAQQSITVCISYRDSRFGQQYGFDCVGKTRSSAGKISAYPYGGCLHGRRFYQTEMFGSVTRPNGQMFVSPVRRSKKVSIRC